MRARKKTLKRECIRPQTPLTEGDARRIVGVLCTMFDTRTSLSHEILARIQEEFGELTFNTTIKTATKVGEAAVADTSVLNYAKNSAVAQSYRELAEEFIKR